MPKRKRDQDGIFTRPDSPYWWASYIDECGKPARQSTGVRRDEDPYKERAKGVRAHWVATAAQEKSQTPKPQGHSFDELMLAYLEGPGAMKRSAERDRYSAKRLYEVFSGRGLVSLTKADARMYKAARHQAGVGPGTINRELGLFSAALNWARRELDWNVPNPFLGMRLPEPDGRTRWLTQAEATALLQAAERLQRAPHLQDFILLGLHTGMRPGELLGLEWKRVDLQANLVYLEAKNQKSGKPGSVPLNTIAREAILSRARFRAQHCPSSAWVFCNRKGQRLQSIKRSFAATCRRAGLTDVHPHDLRRTCGSWLVQKGVPIQHVSKLLRHSDIRITDRVYAHLAPENTRTTVQVLEDTLSRSRFTLLKGGL